MIRRMDGKRSPQGNERSNKKETARHAIGTERTANKDVKRMAVSQ